MDAPRCKQVAERVTVRARWVTVRRGHKRIKVQRRAHTKTIKVTRCHPRTQIARVTVRVAVHRHGKKIWVTRHKRERVVLLPHRENSTQMRVAHGQATNLNGWLGTYTGVALARKPVTILAAPDNGLGQFAPVATVTTATNGTWTAPLPPGPSRLIKAAYNGDPTTEASISGEVNLIVPAKIEPLSVSPRKVAWGATVHIIGQLLGGYLPPGGALVRLRLGYGKAHTTYGVKEHVTGNGIFSTSYTFGAGLSSVHRRYWFQLASLPMGGDYPFSPASSTKVTVLVGGHPTTSPPAHPHHRRRRR